MRQLPIVDYGDDTQFDVGDETTATADFRDTTSEAAVPILRKNPM